MRPRSTHPSTPLVSGLIASLVFLAGAAAFEYGRTSAEADVGLYAEPLPVVAIDTPLIEPPIAQTSAAQRDIRPIVAVVIDDAGVDPALTRRAIALQIAVTMSFLPYAEATPELALAAAEEGHSIFLHMPMEPYGLQDPGPGALTRYLPQDEIAQRMTAAFARVPGAIGFNNHMGSAFTADADAMRSALAPLADSDLIFLDSLTSGRSRAGWIAGEIGLTSLRRDIFIDHDADQVSAMLDAVVVEAQSNGSAIAIGHPRAGTLNVLEEWLESEAAQTVRFVTMQEYVDQLGSPGRINRASNETVGQFGGAE